MRQAKSGLGINKSKKRRTRQGKLSHVTGYTRRYSVEINHGGHEARLNHFHVKIIRPVITKRHRIWRRKQKNTNFKLQ